MTPSLKYTLASFALAGAVSALTPPPTLCITQDIVIDFAASKLPPPPSGAKPRYVGWAAGSHNYTCENGQYGYRGVELEIEDVSCITGQSLLKILQDEDQLPPDDENMTWDREASIRRLLGSESKVLGYMTSQRAINGSYKPYIDFKDFGQDSEYYMDAYYEQNSTAPKAQNPDWAKLGRAGGKLADYGYMLYTHGGKPPASSCQGSATLTVRTTALILLFGGTAPPKSSSTSSGGVGNAGALNAAALSDDDNSNVQKLLNYIPAILGLLGLTTIFSLVLVIFGVLAMCRRRAASGPSRSAAYRPVQLPRAKTPQDGSYHDDLEPYGA